MHMLGTLCRDLLPASDRSRTLLYRSQSHIRMHARLRRSRITRLSLPSGVRSGYRPCSGALLSDGGILFNYSRLPCRENDVWSSRDPAVPRARILIVKFCDCLASNHLLCHHEARQVQRLPALT